MAILATAVWECVSTGTSATNGGGFDTGIAGYGTDYSLQDAPIAIPTDLAMTAGSTTLTSAAQNPFTAAMVGNAIYLTGTNMTADWYFITGYTNAATVTLDRTAVPTTDASGRTGRIGGALKALSTALVTSIVAGNNIWLRYTAGTMTTGGGNAAGNAGTAIAPIRYTGYNTVRGDAPTGASRPTLSHGGNFVVSDYTFVENIIWTGNYGSGTLLLVGLSAVSGFIRNCKISNTGTGASCASVAGTSGKGLLIDNCDILSPASGKGITNASSITNCYIHGSGIGINGSGGPCCVKGNIISGCSTGILANAVGMTAYNNTIYGCTTGVDCGTTSDAYILGNLIDTCTTGITRTTSNNPSNISNYNVFSNNGTDVNNITKGPADVTGNASLNTTTFAVAAGSNVIGKGGPASFPTLTTNFAENSGVDQSDHVAGVSGEPAFVF